MKHLNYIAFVVASVSLLTSGAIAFAQMSPPQAPEASADPTGMSAALTPQAFVASVAGSDAFEISSSRLALKRSQNATIKTFAQRMIADHTKSSTELKAAATKDRLSIAPELDDKHQEKLSMLEGAPAGDFDTNYIAAQTEAHVDAVSLFQTYVSSGQDGAVKVFAARTLPILQMHLAHIKEISTGH